MHAVVLSILTNEYNYHSKYFRYHAYNNGILYIS